MTRILIILLSVSFIGCSRNVTRNVTRLRPNLHRDFHCPYSAALTPCRLHH